MSSHVDLPSTSQLDIDDTLDCYDLTVSSDDDDDNGEEFSSSSEDEDEIVVNTVWGDNPSVLKVIPFTGNPEIRWDFAPDSKPIDYFNVLVNSVFLEHIAEESNRYAEEVSGCGKAAGFKPVTVEELKVFIGLVLHTGTIRMGRLQDYWKTHPLFNVPCFREHMSRNRFLYIMRCLHFCKNDENSDDRLYKIRPIIGYFNNIMDALYYPKKELALEVMMWKGRSFVRQFDEVKYHRSGIKFYTLSEPNGPSLKFIMCGGRDDVLGLGDKNHTVNVAQYLLKEKLGRGHAVYVDEYFSSVALARKLLAKDTYCTGTLLEGRKLNPPEVIRRKLTKGDTTARYANGVMVGKWKNKRTVTYISTEHENCIVSFSRKGKSDCLKPLPLVKYDTLTKGFDRVDQLNSYYPCDHKSLRWYKKVFIHVLQMLLVNSFHLYNMTKSKKVSLYDFRLEVLETLLPRKDIVKRKQTPEVTESRKRRCEITSHTIMKITEKDMQNRTKRKRCRVCYKNGKTTISSPFYCNECPDKPGLCFNCFEEYHRN